MSAAPSGWCRCDGFARRERSDNMAGIEIQGFEELRRNTEHICKDVLDRAIKAAEDAAAEVIKKAVEASAPAAPGSLQATSSFTKASTARLSPDPGASACLSARRSAKASTATSTISAARASPPRPWFETASASVEAQAMEAGIAAFQEVIQRELGQ